MSDSDSAGKAPGFPRLKLGGAGGIDAGAVARAEEALRSLASNFAAWLEEEIVRLEAARRVVAERGLDPETGEGVYLRAHDLKGLGATYEFPIITRIAGSLCRLVEHPEHRAAAPLALIDAHIAAIRSVVRDGVRSDAEPAGAAIAEDLEARVRQHAAR